MIKLILTSLLCGLISCGSQETTIPPSNPLPSLQKLIDASKESMEIPPLFISASDNIQLAYHTYVPDNPKASMIFFHGGGAYSGAGYQLIGKGLSQYYDVAVYIPDLRGHGESQGERGDTPTPKQVWRDVNTFISLVNSQHTGIPLFLGGHSSGAGMVLNYSSWEDRKPVAGYIFLSPQLGYRSKTDRADKKNSFVSVSIGPFVLNSMSFGLLCGHYKAARFNYPANVDSRIVRYNTVNMANALTPTDPHEQFKQLDQSFGMWIGKNDELFIPEKVLAFADLATQVRETSISNMIPEEEHLSILINAHQFIGKWITQQLEKK